MQITQDFDLFFVGVAMVSIGILGFLVFFNNKKSATNRALLLFALVTILWSTFNYLNYQVTSPALVLWLLRFVMFFAVWQAFSFFQLMYVFPRINVKFSKWYKYLLIPLVGGASLLTLTPFVFSGIAELAQGGGVSKAVVEPGIAVFGIVAVGLLVAAVYLLLKKIIRATKLERIQFRYILIGTIATFSLIITFNFVLPVVFSNVRFIPLGPVFVLPFITFTAYAIFKHHLFNVRVIVTEVFISVIILIFLANLLSSNNLGRFLFNLILLITAGIFGIVLVRGTLREISELERLSKAKSDFVAIVSHQLRTPLTAIKGFVSMIREGSGTEESRRDWLDKTYATNERMIRLVDDILNISRIERGKLQYTFKDTDIVNLIEGVISETRMQAEGKGLILTWEKPAADVPLIRADEAKLRQVIMNLVDNAIHYTDNGHINVRLTYLKDLRRIKITVQDTGIGMAKEDLANLFEQFSRGKGGQRTNVGGLGLGLYVAHSIVKSHNGKIWAESDGPHKGSRFYVELPVQ